LRDALSKASKPSPCSPLSLFPRLLCRLIATRKTRQVAVMAILSSLLSPLSHEFLCRSHRSFSPTSGHPSNCYLYCELLENEAPKEATERGCSTERQATEGMFSISPDLLLLAGSWGGIVLWPRFCVRNRAVPQNAVGKSSPQSPLFECSGRALSIGYTSTMQRGESTTLGEAEPTMLGGMVGGCWATPWS
jgi:hypothetical protein